MEILKLIVSYLENFVSVTTSEPMTFFNIFSPGNLRRHFTEFIENISQSHNGYVTVSMYKYVYIVKYIYCLQHILHEWCVSELVIY